MVTRTYRCPACTQKFRITGMASDDDAPPCPKCNWQESQWVPESIAITGSHSKAVDISQKIFEQQFGLTNFEDRLREGDPGLKLNPEQSQMAEPFWGGRKNVEPQTTASFAPNAAAWAAESRRQGVDPISFVQKTRPQPKIIPQPQVGAGVIRQDLGVPKGDD